MRSYWDLLSTHIRPQRGRFIALMILMLSGVTLQVINPQIMRVFIDEALQGQTVQRLMLAAAAFVILVIVQQVVSVSVTYLGESVAWTATNALRRELAWHCLNLDMGFHNNHTPGELIERIDGDINELSAFFSQFVLTLASNFLLMAGILISVLIVEWRAGLAFCVYAVVSVVLIGKVRDLAVPEQKAYRQAEADMFGFVEEQLSGAEDVRSSGAVEFSLRELLRLQGNILKYDRLSGIKNWIIENSVGLLLTIGNMLAIASGYLLYQNGLVTIGTVYLFIYYINLLEQPIQALTRQVKSFQTIGACVQRLSELRTVQSSLPDGQVELTSNGALSLAFENVSFAYNTGESVLHDLSFQLKPGTVLGLLGRTGSGKTSLTRLVSRLYDPTAGKITLDGYGSSLDLRHIHLSNLRQRVAVVTQDVQLFCASVRDNLTFFDRSIPDAAILAAIAELGLDDWYQSLPHGLNTRLETGARSLSAGEAQLLAFTRVFLRQPGLVILDEASSRLDPATERRIEHAVGRLLQGRTAIIVAHRLGTVMRADQIMILEDGQVIECGMREQLERDPASHFYNLLQTGMQEVLA